MKKIGHLCDLAFDIKKLKNTVITCQDAAKAKNIPLACELKTLILTTSNGLYALHLPGNEFADFLSIQNRLNCDEPDLASKKILSELNLQPGTVCPFLDSVWSLPQLISESVFNYRRMSTNSGELDKYIFFDPCKLMINSNVIVGNFSTLEDKS